MRKHKERNLYRLGSLPPFLLEFAAEVQGLAPGWVRHDLGCECCAPGEVQARVMHWSCAGKPWSEGAMRRSVMQRFGDLLFGRRCPCGASGGWGAEHANTHVSLVIMMR